MKETASKAWNTLKRWAKEFGWFISSKIFLKNFAGIIGTVALFLFLTFQWMKCYTHHGESLQVHDYIGMNVDEAMDKAKTRSFSAIVSDSVFVVGKPGNTVLEQNPEPFSRVKEKRKIYLTISKNEADLVTLPDLVGGNDDYQQYLRRLKLMQVNGKIKARRFDSKLEPNTILKVFYNEEDITEKLSEKFQIPMGATVDFIVTERGSDRVQLPDLVCKRYDGVSFVLDNYNLNIGSVIEDNTVTNRGTAYVWKQEPAYRVGRRLQIGAQVDLYLTQYRPDDCGNIEEGN